MDIVKIICSKCNKELNVSTILDKWGNEKALSIDLCKSCVTHDVNNKVMKLTIAFMDQFIDYVKKNMEII